MSLWHDIGNKVVSPSRTIGLKIINIGVIFFVFISLMMWRKCTSFSPVFMPSAMKVQLYSLYVSQAKFKSKELLLLKFMLKQKPWPMTFWSGCFVNCVQRESTVENHFTLPPMLPIFHQLYNMDIFFYYSRPTAMFILYYSNDWIYTIV